MNYNKVKQIQDFGQRIWLDFFDRGILNSGKLKKLIEEDGIGGVQLKDLNIDIDAVTQKLEDEGIEKFNIALDEIIAAIKKKKTEQVS
jgi:hypothetical protein